MIEIYSKKISILLLPVVFSAALFLGVVFIRPVDDANGAEIVDRVAAVVNDEIVSLYELRQAFAPYAARVQSLGYPPEKEKEVFYKIRRDILNQLIDKKLTGQEVKRLDISVTDKEVDSAFERVKEARGFSDEDFRKALSGEKLTIGEYREQLKEQVLRAKLINLEVKSKVVITDEDIRLYYERHKEIYGEEKKYHLRNIIMRVLRSAEKNEKRVIYNRMKDILEKLQAGESFQSLAKSYSESTLAKDGGDLGLFKLDELSPQLQEALSDLKAGMYTPILDTDQGYQIFYVQEIKTIGGKTIAEASSEIQGKLYKEIVDNKFQIWIEKLRNRSHIKVLKYDE
jgi:peptidyl-prolyl cis-trans isomerase SurA